MRKTLVALIAVSGHLGPCSAQAAGVTVFEDAGKYVEIGGRMQLQYHNTSPDAGGGSDELFFRRLRSYIESGVHENWVGKIQFDIGKAVGTNEVAVKDAYLRYTGLTHTTVTIGNAKFPFSRESLTSSKKQQLVERTFVGDHNYGTPDRNLGLHLGGRNGNGKITWAASAAQANIDPDAGKLDFDSPVNRDDDFNEGWIAGGRIEWAPLGPVAFSQGDFSGEARFSLGLGAFSWSNDNDVNRYIDPLTGLGASATKADVDSVSGTEISAAFRGHGWSVDVQYNRFEAEAVDAAFSGGIYRDGETTLSNQAIEGGYMVMADTVELVAGVQSQDADNYAETWDRTSLGANWYLRKHDIKVQLTFRKNENVDGVAGNDSDEWFLQTQYVF